MATATPTVVRCEGLDIPVTNPTKLLWPERGITKADYLQKLVELAPFLLPYCRNRYLTTIRYPHGVGGKSFYQKNAPAPVPAFVRTMPHNGINYVRLASLPTLLWLGNLASLEFHPSSDAVDSPFAPEWLIDIDPSRPDEPRIMEAAEIVGELLDSLGVRSVPKTSGATGIQIYVPILQKYTFDQLRGLGHFIGQYLQDKYPDLFTIERLVKNRGTLIYFDYLQHYAGKTLSAPYTPRARPAATVSAPLRWDEVRLRPKPTDFHLLNIAERLRAHGDLIARVAPQSLDGLLERLRPLH